MSSEILELIQKRDHLLNMYKKTNSKHFYNEYCKCRNKTQREVNKAKSAYFENKIEENKNNPKNIWKQFKSMGYSAKQKEKSKVVLNIDNENCHESNTVANHFNNFFTTVAAKLVSKLPPVPKVFDINTDIFKEFYNNVICNNFEF